MRPVTTLRWLFDSERGASGRLISRWLFLRGLGLIYFSAFFSLVFQIRGLIGPRGILPANEYLQAVTQAFSHVYARIWFAPTLLWFSSSEHMLLALCWVGMLASIALVLNVWPRGMLVVCFLCFVSFVSAAQDFSGYQSDGMLLEAGFISLFFAPPGFWPGLGKLHPPSRASWFMLQWEWFCIYFGSGVVKLASGDPQWRNMTAMDEYYQNGPLPTWIGWYVQHLPHHFHVFACYLTLGLELGLVWMMFLPRRWRIACCVIVTGWQIPVILTANYTFLNYLVLLLGVLLLDDRFFEQFVPEKWRKQLVDSATVPEASAADANTAVDAAPRLRRNPVRAAWDIARVAVPAIMLSWIFYATALELAEVMARIPLPTAPIVALQPFRIADRYGLFAVMTRGRYEIEFQGSQDGQNWVAYPFRYKPQDLSKPPGIYAPYQPRFDWNLWFASLGSWREYSIVPNTEVLLLQGDSAVMELFAGNPFRQAPPRMVRAVLWQYWFTSMEEKRATGLWWRRELLGLYAPTLVRQPDGRITVVEWPNVGPRE